jgi:hypothetical protein
MNGISLQCKKTKSKGIAFRKPIRKIICAFLKKESNHQASPVFSKDPQSLAKYHKTISKQDASCFVWQFVGKKKQYLIKVFDLS